MANLKRPLSQKYALLERLPGQEVQPPAWHLLTSRNTRKHQTHGYLLLPPVDLICCTGVCAGASSACINQCLKGAEGSKTLNQPRGIYSLTEVCEQVKHLCLCIVVPDHLSMVMYRHVLEKTRMYFRDIIQMECFNLTGMFELQKRCLCRVWQGWGVFTFTCWWRKL